MVTDSLTSCLVSNPTVTCGLPHMLADLHWIQIVDARQNANETRGKRNTMLQPTSSISFENGDSAIRRCLQEIAETLKSIERRLPETPSVASESTPRFNPDQRRIESGAEHADLSLTESVILSRLIEEAGNPVSSEALCQRLGLDPVEQRINIKTYVFRLRNKIAKLSHPPYEIRVIRDLGYCAVPIGANG